MRVMHSLEFARFAGLLSGLYIIIFLVNSVVGLFLMIDKWNTPFGITLSCFLGAVALSAVVAIAMSLTMFWRGRLDFLGGSLTKALDGLHAISRSTNALTKSIAVALANVAVFGFATYLEFMALAGKEGLDAPVSLLKSVLLSVVGSFSLLISITPAGLGIRESISIVVGDYIGISHGRVLAVCLLDRTINFLVLTALAGIAYFVLQRRLRAASALGGEGAVAQPPGGGAEG